jgi:hypothetical protein
MAAVIEVFGAVTRHSYRPSHRVGNPSSRRGGVAIRFWCEGCDSAPELTLEQHKGETHLHWR